MADTRGSLACVVLHQIHLYGLVRGDPFAATAAG